MVRARATVAVAVMLAVVIAAGLVVVVVRDSSRTVHSAVPPPPAPAHAGQAAPLAAPAPVPTQSPRRPAHGVGPDPTASRLSNSWGIDVSWPQCDEEPTGLAAGFVTVGINDGRPFTQNPCLAQQVAYARRYSGYAAYLNLDAPRTGDAANWGRRAALDALARARAVGLRTPVLWLDVEVKNHWADPRTNIGVIAAAVRALQQHGVTAGIYSSEPMWLRITAGAQPRVPVWLATTATDYRQLEAWCASGLGGRAAVLTQYVATTGSRLVDVDVLCRSGLPDSVRLFAPGRQH